MLDSSKGLKHGPGLRGQETLPQRLFAKNCRGNLTIRGIGCRVVQKEELPQIRASGRRLFGLGASRDLAELRMPRITVPESHGTTCNYSKCSIVVFLKG